MGWSSTVPRTSTRYSCGSIPLQHTAPHQGVDGGGGLGAALGAGEEPILPSHDGLSEHQLAQVVVHGQLAVFEEQAHGLLLVPWALLHGLDRSRRRLPTALPQILIAHDSGMPRAVILLTMSTPIIASLFCLSNVRARRRSPTIWLNRNIPCRPVWTDLEPAGEPRTPFSIDAGQPGRSCRSLRCAAAMCPRRAETERPFVAGELQYRCLASLPCRARRRTPWCRRLHLPGRTPRARRSSSGEPRRPPRRPPRRQ